MLVKQIGKGSFSNVYLHNGTSGLYIIKEVNINLLVKKYNKYNLESDRKYYNDMLDNLINSEIDILKIINHINIVKYIDSKKSNGIYYISMEYCCYGDVYTLLKQKRYIDINKFARHITNALVYLKELNIIHRDIKLQNVLLDNNIYKLSDFGFACYDNKNECGENKNNILNEKYYKLCGSPMYMAPEIILNMNLLHNFTTKDSLRDTKLLFYDKLIDVWSFGLCLYELQTYTLPFPKVKDINQLVSFYSNKKLSQDYINARIHNEIKSEYKELIDNMLQIENRCDIVYINEFLEKTDYIDDSECLKQHIVYNNIEDVEEIYIKDSWEEINKDSIPNIIYKGFFDWIFN